MDTAISASHQRHVGAVSLNARRVALYVLETNRMEAARVLAETSGSDLTSTVCPCIMRDFLSLKCPQELCEAGAPVTNDQFFRYVSAMVYVPLA